MLNERFSMSKLKQLIGHEIRLAMANPEAEIVCYDGCGHRCHAQRTFDERFLTDLDKFLKKVAR